MRKMSGIGLLEMGRPRRLGAPMSSSTSTAVAAGTTHETRMFWCAALTNVLLVVLLVFGGMAALELRSDMHHTYVYMQHQLDDVRLFVENHTAIVDAMPGLLEAATDVMQNASVTLRQASDHNTVEVATTLLNDTRPLVNEVQALLNAPAPLTRSVGDSTGGAFALLVWRALDVVEQLDAVNITGGGGALSQMLVDADEGRLVALVDGLLQQLQEADVKSLVREVRNVLNETDYALDHVLNGGLTLHMNG